MENSIRSTYIMKKLTLFFSALLLTASLSFASVYGEKCCKKGEKCTKTCMEMCATHGCKDGKCNKACKTACKESGNKDCSKGKCCSGKA